MKTKQIPLIVIGHQYTERLAASQTRDDHESNNASQEYAFGFKNLTVNGKPLSKDDSKFIAYGDSFESAREDFWFRWQRFIKKAFNRRFLPILKA